MPTPFEQVLPSKEILRLCFELRGVNHVASYVAQDQMRIICIDEAPDAETVRVANRHAGMHFDVAWHAADIMEHEPGNSGLRQLISPFIGPQAGGDPCTPDRIRNDGCADA